MVVWQRPLPQMLRRLHQREENDARSTQKTLSRKVILAVGIHDSDRVRQIAPHLVMIEHHHIRARLIRGRDGSGAVDPAIHRHDESSPPRKIAHRIGIGAVALENPVGNIDFSVEAVMRKKALHHGRGNSPIDVIIAKDRHLLAAPHRVGQPFGSLVHVGQRCGIGQEIADGWIEKALCVIHIHAAPGEYTRHDFRNTVRLRHRQRSVLAPQIEPVLPGETARGAPDIEEISFIASHRRLGFTEDGQWQAPPGVLRTCPDPDGEQ